MDKYKQFMLEAAIENTLYHACSVFNAAQVLQEQQFRLTIAVGTDSDEAHQNGKIYFLSTSRSRYNRYVKGKIEGAQTGVMLNLDKSILQQNNAIKPVDYWSWGPDQKELEDRVFSNKPEIKFAGKKLISSVHVLINKNFHAKDIHQTTVESISSIIKQCRREGTELFLYDNFRDFVVQNRKKSISISQYLAIIKSLKVEPRLFSGKGRPYGRSYRLGALVELMQRPATDGPRLGKDAAKLRYSIVYDGWRESELLVSIKAAIHNAKTSDRDVIITLLSAMKKFKVKTLKQMIEKLREKWKEPIES